MCVCSIESIILLNCFQLERTIDFLLSDEILPLHFDLCSTYFFLHLIEYTFKLFEKKTEFLQAILLLLIWNFKSCIKSRLEFPVKYLGNSQEIWESNWKSYFCRRMIFFIWKSFFFNRKFIFSNKIDLRHDINASIGYCHLSH